MSEFARPFKVTYPDGEVVHGVQFPDGFCIVRSPRTNVVAAVAFEHLGEQLDMDHAVVEWQDGGGAEREGQ